MTTLVGHGRKKKSNEWWESNMDYIFNNGMGGTSLTKRLNWIGRTNDLMNKFSSVQNDDYDDDDDNDDNDDDEQGNEDEEDRYVVPPSKKKKKKRRVKERLFLGRGVKECAEEEEEIPDERKLRRAFPTSLMSTTLSNWMLHGQNLGSMLSNYCRQCRNMKKGQRCELAYFFNTASNILDTIGSMTENTILRPVEFDKGGHVNLKGGGLNNKLPPALKNLSRYTAIFPGPSFNVGHVLDVENENEKLFTSDYPTYPKSVVLKSKPNLPM